MHGFDTRGQRLEVSRCRERCQPRLPVGQQAGKFSRLHPILAGAGEDRFHAPLDLRQARRIEIDAIGIATQRRHRLRQFGRRRLQQAGDLLQRRIVARQPVEPGGHAIDLARTGGFAIGQHFEREARAVDQARGMPQALVFDFEGRPFVPGKSQRIELADLPFELFALALQRLGAGRGRLQRLLGFTPCRQAVATCRASGQPGMRVEQARVARQRASSD